MENESTDELMQLIEESWYWSTINDIVDIFDKYGMDNVLADVGNMKIQREEAKSKDIDNDCLFVCFCLNHHQGVT